ncbi:MAG TPA: zf-HC2 domain-containing protein [Candidatus Polarisedimenticolaceae bacterium]|nr:zf-HC2 domain-containing protein [Candidatus Polarisedimenticolaceae bacterium]
MSRCRSHRSLIVASLEGEIAPADALRLARHLHACTACRIVMARESRLAGALDDLGDPVEVDERVFQAVMAALPDRAPWPSPLARNVRRGLKIAGSASVVVGAAALAARLLPSLRFDLATPSLPRFTPEETDGWLSLFGSAAQWVRVTAQSLAWVSAPETFSARTVGVLSLEAALLGAAAFLAVSGALVVASRAGSRAS